MIVDVTTSRNKLYENDTNIKKRAREWYYKLRKECINSYGGKCECCGETEFHFLTIDHVNGGGTKHRMRLGGGTNYLREIRKLGFPEGYRVLCYNCNNALYSLGFCPHTKEIL